MAETTISESTPATPATNLNDLPIEILLRILKFLPLIHAVRTSLISRKWRNLWHFMPTLRLQITEFPLGSTFRGFVHSFANFVALALIHRPNTIPLDEFRLAFWYTENHRHRSLVTSWLRYALCCNVVDIKLNFVLPCYRGVNIVQIDQLYYFHFTDLKNSSVRKLFLCSCRIVFPSAISTRFESLRSVTLVAVDLADDMLSDMISMCENLEELVLSRINHSPGLKKFRICSQNLRKLELDCYRPPEGFESMVEICAPSLWSLKIKKFNVAKFNVVDLSSLAGVELYLDTTDPTEFEAWSGITSSLGGVRFLSVQNIWLRSILASIESGEFFQLNNLTYLEAKTVYNWDDIFALRSFLQFSPRLERLVLDYGYQSDEDANFFLVYDARQLQLNIPSLRVVIMKNFRKPQAEATLSLFSLISKRLF